MGEAQALVLSLSCIDDRYALEGEKVAEGMRPRPLSSMLFEPALENGRFRAADVEREKRCLKELIEAEIDEKRWYSNT